MATTNETQEHVLDGPQIKRPRKGHYRQRAHCNPLSDSTLNYPLSPDFVDWSKHFPSYFEKDILSLELNTSQYPLSYSTTPEHASLNGSDGFSVEFLDVGCGYGGLLVALSSLYPDVKMIGLEIRDKVSQFLAFFTVFVDTGFSVASSYPCFIENVTTYVGERIRALRNENRHTKGYLNISVLRTNVMKFLVNYFRKGQLKKIFFCFPDPHFKKSKWKRRIISISMLSMYAYTLSPDGLLYAVTDVQDLYEWIREACIAHPLFEEVTGPALEEDRCVQVMKIETEEAKKVIRNNQSCYYCVFRRLSNPPLAEVS
ncbi:tRna -methyltransferase family protein [Cardiosporidium cionae]|uniref:tRNA (guanine-N(7)-)-methyltransferase n=1 Tax=Cardiosporidium cionae TaxID=476202 RepID=A0ABQ7JAC0_9APIC|nr:tRna -methyltransferase family protein [Cardiosporidium cionae]|eukprot:KAF8820955.1 tRna -methyltransferase family protein [Cardiosporidium cionae]